MFSKIKSHVIEYETPSRTELHRIRRALWRLRLYYEAYYEPYIALAVSERGKTILSDFRTESQDETTKSNGLWGLSKEAKTEYVRSQTHFFWQMTVWELEELECVWFHLTYQVKTLWRHRCPFCDRNPLPDRYVAHIRECQNPRVTPNDDHGRWLAPSFGPNFAKACHWFRALLEDWDGNMEHDLSKWPEGPAREPSAGFTFRFDHHQRIVSYYIPPTISRPPLEELLKWGYCIWDRERLETCELVDSPERKSLARLELWRTDQ